MTQSRTALPPVDGSMAPGFEAARFEFEHNFSDRKEIGAEA
jgi:hypothetical protein